MENIGTEECKVFAQSYFNKKNISTELEDWELIKKYKNHNIHKCRDFVNKKIKKEVIVIVKEYEQIELIEDANFTYFIEELAKNPVFYYVPLITSSGVVFFFEQAKSFDETGVINPEIQRQKPYLIKELEKIFPHHVVATLGVEMIVAFNGIDVDSVVKRLERNRLSYNPQLFKLLDAEIYKPYIPDLKLAIYDFPEDESLTEDQAINEIFKICSFEELLIEKDYARIKYLLKKVSKVEMRAVEKIALSFRDIEDNVLMKIFESEVERKKLPFLNG